jgi:hypothetical protein
VYNLSDSHPEDCFQPVRTERTKDIFIGSDAAKPVNWPAGQDRRKRNPLRF